MATKTIRIDDFDGTTTEGVKVVNFALDADRYTIDLGPESQKALRDALKPFIAKAQKAGSSGSSSSSVSRPGIIGWLQANGYPNAKGRPSAEQIAAYDAAH